MTKKNFPLILWVGGVSTLYFCLFVMKVPPFSQCLRSDVTCDMLSQFAADQQRNVLSEILLT